MPHKSFFLLISTLRASLFVSLLLIRIRIDAFIMLLIIITFERVLKTINIVYIEYAATNNLNKRVRAPPYIPNKKKMFCANTAENLKCVNREQQKSGSLFFFIEMKPNEFIGRFVVAIVLRPTFFVQHNVSPRSDAQENEIEEKMSRILKVHLCYIFNSLHYCRLRNNHHRIMCAH